MSPNSKRFDYVMVGYVATNDRIVRIDGLYRDVFFVSIWKMFPCDGVPTGLDHLLVKVWIVGPEGDVKVCDAGSNKGDQFRGFGIIDNLDCFANWKILC